MNMREWEHYINYPKNPPKADPKQIPTAEQYIEQLNEEEFMGYEYKAGPPKFRIEVTQNIADFYVGIYRRMPRRCPKCGAKVNDIRHG